MTNNIILFTQHQLNIKIVRQCDINILWDSITTKKKNETRNYERLELLGDAYLYGCFVKYCFTQQPYCKMFSLVYGETICTRLRIKYLSTRYLADICRKIGLNKCLQQSANEINPQIQIEEDILEAWIGALTLLITPNALECYVFQLFDMLNLDLSFESCFDIKTRLNDFASALKCKYVNRGTHFVEERQQYCTEIFFSGSQYNNLNGIGFGDTVLIAEQEAAKNLFSILSTHVKDYQEVYRKTKNWKNWHTFYEQYTLNKRKRLNNAEDA